MNMHLMISKKNAFLAFGGHLFNRTGLDSDGNVINDPALLMYDTFDNSKTTYSSEGIEKLKTK